MLYPSLVVVSGNSGTWMATFGARFGRLVRTRRRQEQLTLEQLAFKCSGTEGGLSKSRISELERGKVDSPHQSTIDALVVALNIPDGTVASCWEPIVSESVIEELSLRRELLESLAARFEYDYPDASDAEIIRYLKQCARRYKEIDKKLAEVEAATTIFNNSIAAARSLMGQGLLEEAEEILDGFLELHSAETLAPEILRTVEIFELKAKLSELGGSRESALRSHLSAIHLLDNIDLEGAMSCRIKVAEAYGDEELWREVTKFQKDTDHEQRILSSLSFLDFLCDKPIQTAKELEDIKSLVRDCRSLCDGNADTCSIFVDTLSDVIGKFHFRLNHLGEYSDERFFTSKLGEYICDVANEVHSITSGPETRLDIARKKVDFLSDIANLASGGDIQSAIERLKDAKHVFAILSNHTD